MRALPAGFDDASSAEVQGGIVIVAVNIEIEVSTAEDAVEVGGELTDALAKSKKVERFSIGMNEAKNARSSVSEADFKALKAERNTREFVGE